MSDFEVPVVRIGAIVKHPNADTLSITEVEGCPVIIRTGDFKEGDLAIYLPVESLIPEGRIWVARFCSHLKFKHGLHRLKAVRLRGIFSMGMVVPIEALAVASGLSIPETLKVKELENALNHNVADQLGVVKYEEPEEVIQAQAVPYPKSRWEVFVSFIRGLFGLRRKAAPRPFPIYGVEHYRKNKRTLYEGEEIIVTEKIHGTNFAAGYIKGKFLVSSHKVLRKEDDSVYWRAARSYCLEERLKEFPGFVVYGEIFGPSIQDMGYDLRGADIELRLFDVYDTKTRRYLDEADFQAFCNATGQLRTPPLYRGPYDQEQVERLADGESQIASHFREGIVIKPVVTGARGRVALKLVGETYLLRKNGTERH